MSAALCRRQAARALPAMGSCGLASNQHRLHRYGPIYTFCLLKRISNLNGFEGFGVGLYFACCCPKRSREGGGVTRVGFHNKGWCGEGVMCRLWEKRPALGSLSSHGVSEGPRTERLVDIAADRPLVPWVRDMQYCNQSDSHRLLVEMGILGHLL